MSDETRRACDLLGLPVYDAQDGKHLGEIRSLLVRPEDSTVAAVGIEGPAGLRRLRYSRLRAVGPDAVMLDHEDVLQEELPGEELADLDEGVVDRPVMTENGHKLGVVIGFRVNPRDGRIQCYRVRPDAGLLAELSALITGDRLEVPVSQVLSVGPEVVIVREEVAAAAEAEIPTPLPPA
jgi:sporulation protein YlmC with PRC-barrel domain